MSLLTLTPARRKQVCLLTLLVLTALIWGARLCPRPGDADVALRANFDRVQTGMSLDEVKGILGPPTFITMVPPRDGNPRLVAVAWEGEEAIARTYVDQSAAVTGKEYGERPLRSKLWGWWRRTFGKAPPP
jgi:hypothetical protein